MTSLNVKRGRHVAPESTVNRAKEARAHKFPEWAVSFGRHRADAGPSREVIAADALERIVSVVRSAVADIRGTHRVVDAHTNLPLTGALPLDYAQQIADGFAINDGRAVRVEVAA